MALELTNNVEANGLEDQVEVRQLIWGLNESSNEFDGFDFNRWWWVVFLLISDFVSLSLSWLFDKWYGGGFDYLIGGGGGWLFLRFRGGESFVGFVFMFVS